MKAKVIAVANMKGGVGKTTTVVGLAETLAAIGTDGSRLNVLVVDLDAQANASYCIAGDQLLSDLATEEKTIEEFLRATILKRERRSLSEYIRPHASALTRDGNAIALGLVAASPELRFVEREIIYGLTERRYSLKAIEAQVSEVMVREIAKLRERYDVIIVDCPPGISAFTEAVLKTSDLIIAPVIPDNLSTLGLKAFCNRVIAAPRADQGSLKLPWVLANRVQKTNIHKNRLSQMRLEAGANDRGFHMFQTEIPQSNALVTAMEYEEEAPTYASKYGEARDILQAVAKEAVEAINAR